VTCNFCNVGQRLFIGPDRVQRGPAVDPDQVVGCPTLAGGSASRSRCAPAPSCRRPRAECTAPAGREFPATTAHSRFRRPVCPPETHPYAGAAGEIAI
jgi:hypothetical protein